MNLAEKYKTIVDAANTAGVQLDVQEKDSVLYISGTLPDGKTKDLLWDAYEKIDANFAGGDLVLDLTVAMDSAVTKVKVITESSNLNIRKGPGTEQPIVGKAAHGEIITLLNKSNEQWWLVRTDDGEEGYAYAVYLEPQQAN